MTKQETITTTGGPFNEDLDMIRDQLGRGGHGAARRAAPNG